MFPMKKFHLWLGLVLLVIAGAIYWAASDRVESPAPADGTAVASTAVEPGAKAASVAASVSGETHRGTPKTSYWRKLIHVVANDGTAAVPSRYQIAGVERVQTGRDFDDWMSHFSEQDQKILHGFDKRFYGVYQGRDADQIAWMAAHGYPMPEDNLAAKFIDTAKLRDLVKQGNLKAAFLLQDRELTEVSQRIATQGKSRLQVETDDPQLRADLYMLTKMTVTSDSPYRAFMWARGEKVTPLVAPNSGDSTVIGALYWAMLLGDAGADQMLRSFIDSSPNASVRAHRQAVESGAAALSSQFRTRRMVRGGAGLPDECMRLFGGNDPYPVPHLRG